jgi:hypothetical protein
MCAEISPQKSDVSNIFSYAQLNVLKVPPVLLARRRDSALDILQMTRFD